MKPAKIVRAFYNDDDILLSAVKTIRENKYHIEEVYTTSSITISDSLSNPL